MHNVLSRIRDTALYCATQEASLFLFAIRIPRVHIHFIQLGYCHWWKKGALISKCTAMLECTNVYLLTATAGSKFEFFF